VKQNIVYKKKSIVIVKEKVVNVSKLTGLPTFYDNRNLSDNKEKEIQIYRKVLEQFNR